VAIGRFVVELRNQQLLARPAIINLDVNAPDTPRAGRTRTYAESAGEMTLYIELYDSVTNKKAAEKILKGWASILLEALDEARQP